MTGRSLKVGGWGFPPPPPRGRDPGGGASPGLLRAAAQRLRAPRRAGRARGGRGERARLCEGISSTDAVLSAARPPGSRGTGRPLGTRLPPEEAAQDPKVRAAGRAWLRVAAESPCLFPRRLGLPPRGASFEAAPTGTKGGAVQQSGSAKTNFSKVPSPTTERRVGALV